MALRDSKVFVGLAVLCAALAILSFLFGLVQKVISGGALETYHNVKGIPWHYSSAAALVVVTVVVVLFCGLAWLYRRIRGRDWEDDA